MGERRIDPDMVPERVEQRVNEAVHAILENLPPAARGAAAP